jgi:O-methyltransferase involved in polyketide biosynthesis
MIGRGSIWRRPSLVIRRVTHARLPSTLLDCLPMTAGPRDFSTIGPSAKSLLIMKSQTSIPFADEAARVAFGVDGLEVELAAMKREPLSGLRLEHFESRYRSLDTLLADTGLIRVLELAAGLSFRGLELARRDRRIYYLDTDLPAIAALKTEIIAQLEPASLTGQLEVSSLDALDSVAFRTAVARLTPGPLAILNEGLLIYLDDAEKSRLAANVREALGRYGGVWITADVYVRGPTELRPSLSPRAQAFLDQHRVEEKKFPSWEAAERFFTSEGFVVRRRLAPSDEPRHIRESWMLSLPDAQAGPIPHT